MAVVEEPPACRPPAGPSPLGTESFSGRRRRRHRRRPAAPPAPDLPRRPRLGTAADRLVRQEPPSPPLPPPPGREHRRAGRLQEEALPAEPVGALPLRSPHAALRASLH